MKRYLLLLFLTLSIFGFSQDRLKYSQAKIFYTKSSDLEVLLSHGVGVDHGKAKRNTYIESVFSEEELHIAQNLGFKVEVSIADWETYYHEIIKDAPYTKSPAPCGSSDYTVPSHFNLGSMGGFLNYTEVLAELAEMQSLYPQLITVKAPISTYTTAQNRSIYWVKISDNATLDEPEPEALYTSLHHAREPGSLQTLIFYMWYLLENYQTDPTIRALVDQSEIFFIPIVNPDGYAYNSTNSPTGGGNWRKNRRNNGDGSYGVDNNRNYTLIILQKQAFQLRRQEILGQEQQRSANPRIKPSNGLWSSINSKLPSMPIPIAIYFCFLMDGKPVFKHPTMICS
jgi:carboxypeptidase T